MRQGQIHVSSAERSQMAPIMVRELYLARTLQYSQGTRLNHRSENAPLISNITMLAPAKSEVISSFSGLITNCGFKVVVNLAQVLLIIRVVIGALRELGDLLQCRLVELRVNGKTVDMQRCPCRAANANSIDAHTPINSILRGHQRVRRFVVLAIGKQDNDGRDDMFLAAQELAKARASASMVL